VAKRAAEWLDDLRVRSVVDIGSGAGKFCVAAALVGRAGFTGLERRLSLVTPARALANVFEVSGRVTFVHGALGVVPTPIADAYYLYNPFGDYWFHSSRDTEGDVKYSTPRRADDIALVEQLIRRAPIGTYLLTYNGFGGRVPECCDQIRVDWTLPGALRLWRKQRSALELRDGVSYRRAAAIRHGLRARKRYRNGLS
jgi:hypothetical protein